jgi:hypothetical protein
MIHIGQINQAWEQGPVTIRALRSLTGDAFQALSDAIAELQGGWILERHDDYDGYLSLLISPTSEINAPTYFISGQLGHIELAQFQGDELHALGRFKDIEATTAELVRALRQSAAAK